MQQFCPPSLHIPLPNTYLNKTEAMRDTAALKNSPSRPCTSTSPHVSRPTWLLHTPPQSQRMEPSLFLNHLAVPFRHTEVLYVLTLTAPPWISLCLPHLCLEHVQNRLCYLAKLAHLISPSQLYKLWKSWAATLLRSEKKGTSAVLTFPSDTFTDLTFTET